MLPRFFLSVLQRRSIGHADRSIVSYNTAISYTFTWQLKQSKPIMNQLMSLLLSICQILIADPIRSQAVD